MISSKAGRRNFKPLLVIIISVAVFFGSIFILDRAGFYTVSLPSQSDVQDSGETIGIIDLRGSMTIEQGAFYTGKTLEDFYSIMKIPADVPKDTQLKNIYLYAPGYDFHTIKANAGSE
jgi:hypothetical protein